MYKFKFADIGEGLHEGVVAEIYKKVGDYVQEGDSLFSVETDKITSDIPSPKTGKITKVLMSEGDTIYVGNEIYHIELENGQVEKQKPPQQSSQPTTEKSVSEPEEKAASVVGEIEQSDQLLDFNNFHQDQPAQPTQAKTEEVDVVIIGSGPGGYFAGELAGKANLKTVVIEKDTAGGVCLNVGCIPTKALLKSAKLYNSLKKGGDFGFDYDIDRIEINWKQIQKRKTEVVNQLTSGVEYILQQSKARLIQGTAKILDRYTVSVNDLIFKTKYIIVAIGSSPIYLPLSGFDKGIETGHILDSTQALDLKEIPKNLTIVGGGVIGLEFATLYNQLGSNVTIIEGFSRILPTVDEQVTKTAHKIAVNNGINIITGGLVKGWDPNTSSIIYELNGEQKQIVSDKVLISVGRKPNSINIDQTTDVKLGTKGEILVDNHMRTNVDNIFAIGDVVGDIMLAHLSYRHAVIVMNTILGIPDSYNKNLVPVAIYTYPEIALIGQTEEQLKAANVDYLKVIIPNTAIGKAWIDGDTRGFTKLLFTKEDGEILGCHMINESASDIISELTAFMELESTIFDIAKTIHPHPTIAESLLFVGMAAINVFNEANNK